MRILHLVRRSEGGLKSHILTIARGLDKTRFEMEIAASFDEPTIRYISEMGIKYFPVEISDRSSPGEILRAAARLRGIVKKEGINLVHAHGFVAGLVAQVSGVQSVITFHNFPPDKGLKWLGFREAEKCLGRRTCQYIAVSEALRESLSSIGIDRYRVKVIYNGIDDELFDSREPVLKREFNIGEGFKLVVCVARLIPEKGVEYFIRAASLLKRDRDDVYFMLIGDGPMRGYLEGMVGELGLSERFIFAGYREDAGRLLSGCDIFVLPSLKEGLGISLLEAMASKVPCIASKVGGIPEVLGEGMGGILVKPGDYMELYAAMRYLLNNRDKSVELAEKGYNLAKNGFRSADMIKDLESVYLSTGLM